MKKYFLGIDLGSGSVKLTLLSKDGVIAGISACEYPTKYPQIGWAEQSPEDWRKALKIAIKKIFDSTGISKDEILAIAPDAATHTAVLLDENYVPLTDAILWTDQRSFEEVEYLNENYKDAIYSEALNSPTTVWTLPQFLWIQKHKPNIWKRVHKILFAKDYLRYCLTDTVETDSIDAMGSMFYDAVKEKWSDTLCSVANIPADILPKVSSPTALAGYVTAKAAEEFQLAEGTPVYVGSTDTVMEQIAVGNIHIGDSSVKLATAGRICVITDGPIPSRFIFNYRHVIPGLWYPGTATSSCAASFRWYRDALGNGDYNHLTEGAAGIKPGCDGLIFHPYLQGELTPYNDASLLASFTGISSGHSREHFTRAVLEGVAFSLKDCLSVLDESDVVMKRTRILGGGAKSSLWSQIISDVTGLTLEKVEVDDSSFGSAMLAGVACGGFESLEDATYRCIKVKNIFYPNPDNHKLYEKQFKKYKMIHDVLAEVYHLDD